MWLLHWLTFQMTVWPTTETLLIWQISSLLSSVHCRREQQYVSLLWHVVRVDKRKAFLKKEGGLEFPLHFCPKKSTCTVLFSRRQEAAEGGLGRDRMKQYYIRDAAPKSGLSIWLCWTQETLCLCLCVCVRSVSSVSWRVFYEFVCLFNFRLNAP